MGTVTDSRPVLFDTNILIDHLNGISQAAQEIRRSKDAAISIITWIEVMAGAASPDEETLLRSFLLNFKCLPITREVAECAAAIRRQKRIKMPDAIILATAEMNERQLLTRNVKDFPAGMRGVRVPYKL